jgi:Lipid A 3-O-deacylase (PagL)
VITSKSIRLCAVSFFGVMSHATPIQAKIEPECFTAGAGVTGLFDRHTVPVYLAEVRFTPWFWQLRPWVHASLSGDDSFQAAAGLAYSLESPDSPWSASLGFGPGYYNARNGKDLGGNYQNMSFFETGYRFDNRCKLALRFTHLSNGGVREHNPGTDRLTVDYSIPLGR